MAICSSNRPENSFTLHVQHSKNYLKTHKDTKKSALYEHFPAQLDAYLLATMWS
jgi:hypothetical protein